MHQGQPSPSPRKTLQGPAKTALGKLNLTYRPKSPRMLLTGR